MSIKEGYLKKWSETKHWTNVYCKLLQSGWFQWFDSASSTSPKRSVDIRRVAAFLAIGDVIHRVPCKPTSLTSAEIPLSFGIPFEPHVGTKMAWFVCPDQATLNSWTNAIMSLFQQGGAPAQQPLPSYQPPVPAPAPGVIGFGMPDAAAYGGNPGGFAPLPAQPPPPSNYPYPTGNYAPPPTQSMAPVGGNPYVPGTSTYGPPQQGQYYVGQNGQPYQVVYVDGKPKKKKFGGGLKNAAVGLATGVAGGYLASRLFGGWGSGWGGGCHGFMGPRWGSWSSLSSFSWSD